MKILLIDNNDSFTYNVLHLIKSVCDREDSVIVCPVGKLTVPMTSGFDRIIISPGPGAPSEAPILGHVVKENEGRTPILGICLGHQAIGEYYGAATYNMKKPLHGVRSVIEITDSSRLFSNMDEKIMVGRYHSWCVSEDGFPDSLKITAVDDQENIMALSHREYDVFGVQFHPESFMTDCGGIIMSNFLNCLRV